MEYLRINFVIIILTTRFFAAENFVYEVKSLFAQPDYRSVTLTFEVEKKNNTSNNSHRTNNDKNDDGDDDEMKERKFNINFCELQSWDEMHRCRSIVLKDSKPRPRGEKSITYKTVINKLRMSTKYSFNVKMFGEDEKSARSDDFMKTKNKVGQSIQSIIVPTKGFSASASKCLPNESEIVVETGPNFSGRISSENGKCFIDGNSDDSTDSYTLHIDHEECGSKISHDDLTVETFITVQENSGILTHSSRKFMVVCTFQPDTLTVRARLALPKKGEANVIEDDDFWIDRGRSARHQKWQMVDKSALILKESSGIESSEAIPAVHQNEIHQNSQLSSSSSLTMNDLPRNAVKKTESNQNEKKTRFLKFTATERTYASTFSFMELFVGILIVMTIIVTVIFLLKFFTFNKY